ncbi:hypothetical protein NQZ68_007795 [Dissostichus eleginoides]|nr:hypothetical protein NQZ68_007795 [Dissostichus eleginoides]
MASVGKSECSASLPPTEREQVTLRRIPLSTKTTKQHPSHQVIVQPNSTWDRYKRIGERLRRGNVSTRCRSLTLAATDVSSLLSLFLLPGSDNQTYKNFDVLRIAETNTRAHPGPSHQYLPYEQMKQLTN